MENIKKLFEKYRVYLTRPRLELATVVVIGFCAVLVFLGTIPKKGTLKLNGETILYDGSLVRGKMNGQGTVTFPNGDTYTGEFRMVLLMGRGLTKQKKVGFTKVILLMARPKEKEN